MTPDGFSAPDIAAATDGGMIISAETLGKLGRGRRNDGRRWLKTWIDNEINAKPINGPTEKPANVRIGTVADELGLHRLMMLDVEENARAIAEPCPDKVMEHIQAGTRRRGAILAMIDGPKGEPVACMNLQPFQWWWSKAYFLQEVWNYVHPDHRASKHADSLMKFARWASDNMTAQYGNRVYLLQGVTSKDNVQKKVAFYSRYGNYIGSFFIYPDAPGIST